MQTDFETRAELQGKLDRLYFRKRRAQQHLSERGQHPTVLRFHLAREICAREGLAEEWDAFAVWYVSMRAVQGGPDSLGFFLNSPDARKLGVRFDMSQDREALKLYCESRTAFEKVEREEEQLRTALSELPSSL